MRILSIETSCDETALSIVRAKGDVENPSFTLLGSALYSQVAIHGKYGGVFPNLARREHQKNLIPLLGKLLEESNFKINDSRLKIIEEWDTKNKEKISDILTREPELLSQFLEFIPTIQKPDIDAISVTYGPGLEPALWVGINFAKALSCVWNLPLVPINHMEGHIASVLLLNTEEVKSQSEESAKLKTKIEFPALALLISGGHTELVHIQDWTKYKVIGQTVDDAVGEAFDKVARMMNLPYPGGPHISALAEISRTDTESHADRHQKYKLPRPMIHSKDFNFSFSGLKTAVLYLIKKIAPLQEEDRKEIAREFEDSVTEVLVTKTRKALEKYAAKTLIIGGGVIANTHLRTEFEKVIKDFPETSLLIPKHSLTTDNATMIALAGYIRILKNKIPNVDNLKAEGNLKL